MSLDYYYIPIIVGLGGILFYFINSSNKPKSAPVYNKPVTSPTTPKVIGKPQQKKKSGAKQLEEGYRAVKIFFGSQTGTAEDFSRKLATELKRYKFVPEVIDCEEYDWEDLAEEKFAIFVMATYGEGEPTDNARTFDDWISDETLATDLLSNLEFTVFGLGNKTYEHFNAVARKVDKRLEELGAKRIYKRGEGDDDASLEDDFAAWKKDLWPALCDHFGIDPASAEDVAAERRYRIQLYGPDAKETQIANTNKVHLVKRIGSNREGSYDIKNPYIGKIVVSRELHTSLSDRSCRHIEIEIGNALKYEVGDHLGVYVENDSELVEAVAKRLEVDLDAVFSLFPLEAKGTPKAAIGPCPVRQALMQLCDLTTPPRKTVIKVLASYASDEAEKKKLLELCDENNSNFYNQYIKDDQRTVLELLNEFKSVKIPFDHFMEITPRLAARMYSISSSLKAHPGRVHITCVLVNYVTGTGRKHKGVATNWLTKQIPSEDSPKLVPVFIEKSNFRLPKDPNTPIVMVGPGTGLAPFRGFIQERKHFYHKGHKSDSVLFFGCRSKTIDYIYEDELNEAKAEGYLTELFIAFSREVEKKIYVQHKMTEFAQGIWNLLEHKKGYFYICGDARLMAKDVRQTLKTIIMEHGEKTDEEAEAYIVDLQKTGRYLTDVWF